MICTKSLTRLVEGRRRPAKRAAAAAPVADESSTDDDDEVAADVVVNDKASWSARRRAIVEETFAFAPSASMPIHDVWTALHAASPALFNDERRDMMAVGRFLSDKYGQRVRIDVRLPRHTATYAVKKK